MGSSQIEAVAKALGYDEDNHTGRDDNRVAEAVIEALREGAPGRVYAELFDGQRGGRVTMNIDLLVTEVVDAILGPKEEA